MSAPDTKKPDHFTNLVNLLSVFSEASAQMTALQAEIDQQRLDVVDEHKARYADLQKALTESEDAIKALGALNPAWFEGKAKNVETPFGKLSARSTKKHEAPDEPLSIALIETAAEAAEALGKTELATLLRSFVRVEKSLDLEALEKADTDLLAKLRIVRIEDTSYTVRAATVNLGQAVKTADKRAVKKAGEAA
jgi:hypothetical protein